jgi:pimeloyl-ACP methyl ester carboxylesterase
MVTAVQDPSQPAPPAFAALAGTRADRRRLVLEAFAGPATRTAGYLSPGRLRRRQARHRAAGIPAPVRSAAVALQVALDEAVLGAFRVVRDTPTAAELDRIRREVDDALDLYERRGWLADPAGYHRPPHGLAGLRERRARSGRLVYEELSFVSEWVPHPGEPGRERWLRYRPNHIARAHVLRHDGRGGDTRPWVVCVHGTSMGRADVDLRAMRAYHLYRDLGCNVVLPVLPLHGRRQTLVHQAAFPTPDALDNVHGLAQAVADVRALVAWVRSHDPSGVALLGVSLGGHVAAMVAGLEPEPFDAVLPIVPVVDFPAVFRRGAPPSLRPLMDAFVASGAGTLHEVVSPLRVEPATPPARRYLAAGVVDRLLDPLEQAVPLWRHWGEPEVCWFDGGHVGHLLNGRVNEFVDDVLARNGVVHA